MLYLDGQRLRDIAIIAVAVLALLVTLVLITPRLGEPETQDAGPRPGTDGRAAPHETEQPVRPLPESLPPFASGPIAEPAAWSPESDDEIVARQSKPTRRAKRGRRRR